MGGARPDVAETRRLLAPYALARARRAFGRRGAGNGTPFADAVAVLLAGEVAATAGARARRDPEGAVAAFDDEDVERIAMALEHALGELHYGATDPLPSGVRLRVRRRGLVGYRGVEYALSRDHAGLHPFDAMPDGSRAIEAWRRDVADVVNAAAAADAPRVAASDVVVEEWGPFRHRTAVPQRLLPNESGDVVYPTFRVDAMTDADRAEEIGRIVDHARQLARRAADNDADVAQFRAAAERVLDAARATGVEVAMDGIRVRYSHQAQQPCDVEIGIRGIGNNLLPETSLVQVSRRQKHGVADLERILAARIAIQKRRQARRAAAAAQGGTGRIDTITLAALRALEGPVEPVLAAISAGRMHAVDAPWGDRIRLSWRDGVVRSNFRLTETARWRQDRIALEGVELPASACDALRGRPLTDVVAHRFLDPAATVTSVARRWGDTTVVGVRIASVAFDAASGRVLD